MRVVVVKKDSWNWMLSNFIEVSLQTLFYYIINKYLIIKSACIDRVSRINRKTRDIMICLTVKIRFGDHETARHGSRNMKYSRHFLAIWEHLNDSISQSILNEMLKMMILLLRLFTHTHIYILIYTHTSKKYIIIMYNIQILCSLYVIW